ncbi:MAG TPA: DoxX family protein [Burkholderiaceae bacterium]|nr:DoxX family protein [Burkholderiaceae bacterium]
MIDTKLAPYAALLLRVALGVMFIAHGLTKWLVFTLPGAAKFFASVGFPGWTAYPVTFLEIVGGAALVAGIFVRPLAAVFTIELLAVASVHLPNGWLFTNKNGGWEYPVFLAFASAALALLGEGAYALRRQSKA